MPPDAPQESSSATQEVPIEKWTGEQRSEWLKTGNTPTEAAPTQEESSEAAEAAGSEPESDPGTKQESPQPKPTGKGAEKRIQELLRQKRELEEENARLRKPPEAAPPAPKPEETPKAPERPVKPKYEDFDSLEAYDAAERPVKPKYEDFDSLEAYDAAVDKYQEDLTDWKLEQRLAKEEAARAERAAQAERANAWRGRVEAAKTAHADYDAVAFARELPVTKHMASILMESEAGAEVLYHLGKHPEEAARIAGLGEVAATRELLKLEATFATPTKGKPEPKTTAAAPPPKELGQGTTAPADEAAAALQRGDFVAYQRLMNARETKRG